MPRKKATPKKRILPKTLTESHADQMRRVRVDRMKRIVAAVSNELTTAKLTEVDYALLGVGKHVEAINEAIVCASNLRAQTIEEFDARGVEKCIANVLVTHIPRVVEDEVRVICDSRVVNGYHIVESDLHRDDDGDVHATYHRARVARFEIEFHTTDINGKSSALRHLTLDAIAGMELEYGNPTDPDDEGEVAEYRHVRAKAQEDLVMNGVASPGLVSEIYDDLLAALDWPCEAREALAIEFERSTDITTTVV